MTVSEGHPASQDDPQASLRVELVGQLAAAQLALEAAIAELSRAGGDSAALSVNRAQLSLVIGLRQQINAASGSALANLRNDVVAAAAAATALAQQATGSSVNAGPADDAARMAAARQTLQAVGNDLFERRVLDPYLQFSSPEDEAAYRKRERENKEAYEREMAKGTTEGALNAQRLIEHQLRDAGAHGADASPDYGPMLESVHKAKADLMGAGQSQVARATTTARPSAAISTQDGDLESVLTAFKGAGVTTVDRPHHEPRHGLAEGKLAARVQATDTGRA